MLEENPKYVPRAIFFLIHSAIHIFYHTLFWGVYMNYFLLPILQALNLYHGGQTAFIQTRFAHSQDTTIICEPEGTGAKFFDVVPGFYSKENKKDKQPSLNGKDEAGDRFRL
jgi:hypothetical protein